MKSDLLMLTLMYSVACAAFIGAINSRGPVRVAISYFLAILTLCAAVYHTSQALSSISLSSQSEDAVVVLPPPPSEPSPAPTPVAQPRPSDSTAITASKSDADLNQTKLELLGVLQTVQRISKNISSLNLGAVADISDEEYESLQNKTLNYLSESRKAKEKLLSFASTAHGPLKLAFDDLSGGVNDLVTAATNAERFFKSENDSEEKARLAAFRHGIQTANAQFKKAGSELGSENSPE